MSFKNSLRLNDRLFMTIIFGLSSGLPLAAIGSTLALRMLDAGIDIEKIGLFALTGLPYSYKFLWSPFMDRFSIHSVGRRRTWMIITQTLLVLLLLILSMLNPLNELSLIAVTCVFISFVSASQDIVLDAYRRDILSDDELGLGSSLFVTGYRIALLIGGAFAIWFSDFVSWKIVYTFLASWIVVGLYATIISPEPHLNAAPPRTLRESVLLPLKNFFSRSYAVEILIFILLYKLGDTLAAAMSHNFFAKIGFSRAEIGLIGKTFGMSAAITGGIIGGSLIPRLGLIRSLWVFGTLQLIGILPFSYLAIVGPSQSVLAGVISIENFTSGMGTAAFITFLAMLCDKRYSATQYALLTSLMALPRTLFASGAGYAATATGWAWYFILCAMIAIPGLLLLIRSHRWLTSMPIDSVEVS